MIIGKLTEEQYVQTQEAAVAACADYAKAREIKAGLSGKQHAGMIVHALIELSLLDEQYKHEAFAAVAALENGSALRQQLEKMKVLGKAAAMTEEYI